MRRKALALSLMAVLLASLISGCISENKTSTSTISKTPTQTTNTQTPSTPSSRTLTTTTSNPKTHTSTTTSTTLTPCANNSWRNNFEEALKCALKPEQNRNFNPVFSLSLTGNKTQDALIITDFLVNYVHLDKFVENQSMKKGHYYDIKTPYELFQTRIGTYADMALFGAYALARDGFKTYIFYIKTKHDFGILPGFKLETNKPYVPREPFVIFWPFRIPMRLSAALEMLNLTGDPPKSITIYKVTYTYNQYHVEKLGTLPADKFKFDVTEWIIFGELNPKTMNNLLHRDYPECNFTYNLSEISSLSENVKSIQVKFPYGLLFYSVPFSQRYTQILYAIMISNSTIRNELSNCKFIALSPAPISNPNNPPTNYTAIYTGWISR